MTMHLPFTPRGHVQLIADCYPPSAALLTSGSDYRPNSSELSKLTYYAANKPSKINKLGNELEKRVKADCRRAQAGNARARATLLITLSILKALVSECRRDISLLSSSLVASVEITITTLISDLEVMARAATLFTAWTTYTDGHLLGVDNALTRDYMTCLKIFAQMSRAQKPNDVEITNRTRLIGLAALAGAVTSDALYSSSTQFTEQVSIIVPGILINAQEAEIPLLEEVSSLIKENPTSQYVPEFKSRPPNERRAASIHVHVDGEKGPAQHDVIEACTRILFALLGHSNGAQVGHVMQAAFSCLEETRGWDKVDHCRWFARKSAEWSQYQYRYAVPSQLVERLLEAQAVPTTTSLHRALASMITTVFTSPTPLVNLSTSDIISNLITLLLRRIAIDPDDTILQPLVDCIASLGTHVYYADQIQDLAAELISRLTIVELHGVSGGSKADKEKCRSQAIRCLLAGLLGLMNAADGHEFAESPNPDHSREQKIGTVPLASSSKLSRDTTSKDKGHVHVRPSCRTRVAPEVWQDTLTLLCDGDFSVRAEYARTLQLYLKGELPGEPVGPDGVRRIRPLAEGPIRQASSITVALYGDDCSRLLSALHAYLYVLATSPSLGTDVSSSSPSVLSYNGDLPSARTENEDAASQAHSHTNRRSITVPSRQRKVSAVQSLLEHAPSQLSGSVSATASDYALILSILTVVHERLPVRALLTGVPMLMSLQAATQGDDADDEGLAHRRNAIREIVAKTLSVVASVWDSPEITGLVNKEGTPTILPNHHAFSEFTPGTLRSAVQPAEFGAVGEPYPALDPEIVFSSLASNRNIREATGFDTDTLLRRLVSPWTPQSALRESIGQPQFSTSRGGSALKLAPSLMHIENISLQSLNRNPRGVGVMDLRDALEGRGGMSNPALTNYKAPSISTFDHGSSIVRGNSLSTGHMYSRSQMARRPRTGNPGEVRDVLNRLGIGKQNEAGLRASFPIAQKSDTRARASTYSPPYKA